MAVAYYTSADVDLVLGTSASDSELEVVVALLIWSSAAVGDTVFPTVSTFVDEDLLTDGRTAGVSLLDSRPCDDAGAMDVGDVLVFVELCPPPDAAVDPP